MESKLAPAPSPSQSLSLSLLLQQAPSTPHMRLTKRRDRVAFPQRLSLREFCSDSVPAPVPPPRARPAPQVINPSLSVSDKGELQALLLAQGDGESQRWRESGLPPVPACARWVGDTPATPILLDDEVRRSGLKC